MRTRCALALAVVASACASTPQREPWEERLRGDAIVLLGEIHDDPEHHRLRLALLERAFAAGWRPAIALEQLDRERQADVDRARRERPGDAQHVIDSAGGPGWRFVFYRPFIELALRYDVPLVAANLSSADAREIVRGGYAARFDAESRAALGLDRSIPPDWQAAQEREIDAGHCHMLPPERLPDLVRVQFARDAVLAAALRAHAARGVVLLAGNGHVRRDLGVARWLGETERARSFAVGFLEADPPPGLAAAFDAVVVTPHIQRPDPCAAFAPAHGRSAPRRRPRHRSASVTPRRAG